MSTTELFSRQAAAEYLSQHLAVKDSVQWSLWLRNNANTARRAVYRLPIVQIGRGSFYSPDELEKFVRFEQGRQVGNIKLTGRAAEVLRAFGVGEPGSTSQGRRWNGGYPTVQNADDGTGVFVRLTINEPLTVWRMTPEEAVAFGKELIEVGEHAVRTIRQGKQSAKSPDLAGYTTVTDNKDMLVLRKKGEREIHPTVPGAVAGGQPA